MHESIAQELLDKQLLDKVIFVPTSIHYQYKTNLLEDNIRLDLIKKMIQNNPNMEVSSYELQEREVHTYETLDFFQKKYPHDKIFFVCGADNLSYISNWEKGEYILQNYPILLISRETNNLEKLIEKYQKYRKNIIVTDISSTYIREKLKKEDFKSIECYLSQEVLEEIKKRKLYR